MALGQEACGPGKGQPQAAPKRLPSDTITAAGIPQYSFAPVGFFDDIDLPPAPPRTLKPHRGPWWVAPPPGQMPGVVEDRLLLGRTPEFALAVGPLFVYPNGVEVTLRLFIADDAEYDPRIHKELGTGGPWEPEPTRVMRWGVDYGDGRRATNLGGYAVGAPRFDPQDPDKAPSNPVLMPRGGSGTGGDWMHTYWLHPLPEEGKLAFVMEWAHRGIPETRTELEADLLTAAAKRAWSVWDS